MLDDDGFAWSIGVVSMLGESAQFELSFSNLVGTDTVDPDMETTIGIVWGINDTMDISIQRLSDAEVTAIGFRIDQ